MAIDIDLYKNLLTVNNVGKKDGSINSIKNSISLNFSENPSWFEVLIDSILREIHIMQDGKRLKALSKPNETISEGNIIQVPTWNNKMYLCVEMQSNEDVQSRCFIKECNNILTFQDEELNIITSPCVLSKKTPSSSDGVKTDDHFVNLDLIYEILIPKNISTKLLKENQRFIFNNSIVFETLSIDALSSEGIITLVVRRDVTQNDDRLDLNIANYKEPQVDVIMGSNEIKMFSIQTYITTFDVVTWSISNDNALILSHDNRSAVLRGETKGLVDLFADDGTIVHTKNIEITNLF